MGLCAGEANDIQWNESRESGEEGPDNGLTVQRAGQYLGQMIQGQERSIPMFERVALLGELLIRLSEFL